MLAAVLVVASVTAVALLIVRPVSRLPGDHRSREADRERPNDAVAAFEWAAAEIRSGVHTASAVLTALCRHPGVLPSVRMALDRGVPLARAVDETESNGEDLWFAHALRLCDASSATSAEVLERAVAGARERRAWSAERRTQSAQARLSARLLTLVPLVFAAWGIASSPSVRSAYRATPLTMACTAAGLVLNVVGWWWMHHLVGRTDAGRHAPTPTPKVMPTRRHPRRGDRRLPSQAVPP